MNIAHYLITFNKHLSNYPSLIGVHLIIDLWEIDEAEYMPTLVLKLLKLWAKLFPEWLYIVSSRECCPNFTLIVRASKEVERLEMIALKNVCFFLRLSLTGALFLAAKRDAFFSLTYRKNVRYS